MKKRFFLMVLIIFIVTGCAANSAVKSFQPNVRKGGNEGGRAVAIAVKPDDEQTILVASDSGGLFMSNDGGTYWSHIKGMKSNFVYDIAFAPGNPNIVIAAAQTGPYRNRDFKTKHNGGIWRSIDGGITWTRPENFMPPPSNRCTDRAGANSVSFEPGSNYVYVGTDCGLAVSNDLGATWTHIVPDPSTAFKNDTQHRVWSVLAQEGGRLNLAANDGLWYKTDRGDTWHKATSGAPNDSSELNNHGFAASPYDSRHIFHAGRGNKLFLTTDGGSTWTDVTIPPNKVNRTAFVRVAKAISPPIVPPTLFYVYWGDGVNLWRQSFKHTDTGPAGSGIWTPIHADHSDPADIAFKRGVTPILLVTDGGIHKTSDNGLNWQLIGGYFNGFNALQIYQVTGQSVEGTGRHEDLYFGTQDNALYASKDGGITWFNRTCPEGSYIQVAAPDTDDKKTKVTAYCCCSGENIITGAHFENKQAWRNPPDGDSILNDRDGIPILLKPGQYVQNTINHDLSPIINKFKLTIDNGGNWDPSFTINQPMKEGFNVAGSPSNPTIYLAVDRGGGRRGLVKITNLLGPGAAVVSDADVYGLGSIGIFGWQHDYRSVVSVDPNNPDRLITADIDTDEMKHSYDGGKSWHLDPILTTLVTRNGKYRFRIGERTFVQVIAFDPYNSCHVLVGTAQNGVIRSTDGGRTWERIKCSTQIPNITSFYFPSTGDIIVSSYGRGLWKLHLDRSKHCELPKLPLKKFKTFSVRDVVKETDIHPKDFRELDVCPDCQYIIVKNGRITDIMLDDRQQLSNISISRGSIHQFDAQKKEVPLSIPNIYSTKLGGFGGNKYLMSLAKERTPIRGVVVEGSTLRGVISSDAELPITPAHTPYVSAISDDMRGGTTKIEPGGTIIIYGEGFAPTTVKVFLDNEIVKEDVKVDAKGTFSIKAEVNRMPGDYEIMVEQSDDKRASRAKTMVLVITQD